MENLVLSTVDFGEFGETLVISADFAEYITAHLSGIALVPQGARTFFEEAHSDRARPARVIPESSMCELSIPHAFISHDGYRFSLRPAVRKVGDAGTAAQEHTFVYVNGQKLSGSALLSQGDTIKFGNSETPELQVEIREV